MPTCVPWCWSAAHGRSSCASGRFRAGAGEILVEVEACGVCRTDLHVVDGELRDPKLPIVPGHEIVGRVAALGPGVRNLRSASASACRGSARLAGFVRIAGRAAENLCDAPVFTGYTRDGGYATHTLANARFCFPLPENRDDAETAPLLCAGLIGWRSYRMAGAGRSARASMVSAPPPTSWRRSRSGRAGGCLPSRARATRRRKTFARSLGAEWAGGSDEMPPEPLDAAIIFAPVGGAGAGGACGGAERRPRGLRRHPHVGHSELSLRVALGGAANPLGREFDPRATRTNFWP